MKGRRSRLLVLLAVLAAPIAASCSGAGSDALHHNVERELNRGRELAANLIARGRVGALTDQEVIALGYLERLRLGLGSPFRLLDYALHDPRLDDSARVRLGWALLARTLDRAAYEVDPSTLDRAGPPRAGPRAPVGAHHLELITDAIREAPDPRGGELAVRLAYALAEAEGSVSRQAPEIAAQVAALLRDREIARADVLRLLLAAQRAGTPPLALASEWRASRRFQVERPPLEPLPAREEQRAIELAPRLAASLRALGPRLAGAEPQEPAPAASLLGRPAALRLAQLADSLNMPPQTPVVLAVDVRRHELADAPGLGPVEQAARRRFLANARNEERFAAEYALLLASDPGAARVAARSALAAAVALRTYAQEEVWFPGFGGPSTRELEDRFGLASVQFGDGVPSAWRPYYRRMLAQSLADLQRVLPALDTRGLRVRFARSPGRDATLALHDPSRRTVYFPPETGAGTIAHEIAHDLDWQVALKRYRVRGDYATDRATRRRGDRLSLTVQGLTRAALLAPEPGDPTPPLHSRRPAEVFARSMDWFVVVSLAREGRINGYLSSVQDDVLTGYGTVLAPDVTGAAGAALIAILDEVAPVHPETRERFLHSYGPARTPSAYDLVRRVLEANGAEPASAGAVASAAERPRAPVASAAADMDPLRVDALAAGERKLAVLEAARDSAFAAIDAWVCRGPAGDYVRELEASRRQLVARTAAAAARGIALEHAEQLAGEEGRRHVARAFFGAPWPSAQVDPAMGELLDGLVARARELGSTRIDRSGGGFDLATAPTHCAPGLLALR
ncbi:MAG TPA: hypothetical protein VF192_16160 [Longimicrobiales bacterium]